MHLKGKTRRSSEGEERIERSLMGKSSKDNIIIYSRDRFTFRV